MANYKINDIEGIGPMYAEKFTRAGIKSVGALLKQGCTFHGRRRLAEKTGIEESTILRWVNMADLYRVKGIGSEYSELLEKAGVDTVKELRLEAVNTAGRALVRKLPSLSQVQRWVKEAKKIDPMVTY
jgi:predicted flap endonuclease-1-like 5' DNA nuclease